MMRLLRSILVTRVMCVLLTWRITLCTLASMFELVSFELVLGGWMVFVLAMALGWLFPFFFFSDF